ncbi:caspase family protein [Kaarinaea lacus]
MSANPYIACCLALIIGLFSASAFADVQTALAHYQQGERHYQKQEFEQALNWYRKAIELRPQDGAIVTQRHSSTKSQAYGRLVKRITTEDVTKLDYFPNQRITEIKRLFEEQQRHANPPVLELQWMTLREPTRDNVLDGGESGTIVVDLKNSGKSPALDVKLAIQNAANGLLIEPDVTIGEIKPQSTYTANIDVSAARDVQAATHKISITAKERSGFDSNTLDVMLQTKPHQPPNVVIDKLEITDFNANERIEPTEAVTIKGVVFNNGAGVSNSLNLDLNLGENLFTIPGSEKTIAIGQLYPGDAKPFEFSFISNRRLEHKQALPVALLISDMDGKQLVKQTLALTMYAPQATTRVNVQPTERAAVSNLSGVDVDINIPQGTAVNPDAVAVVIGNKNYQVPDLPPVQYALNDARVIKDYLIKTMGFSEHNIIYMENASAARFNETFGNAGNFAGKLYNYVKPGKSDVFIYYSGHGAPDLQNKGAFFVPVDVNPNYIATSGYSLDLFYSNISKIPARSLTVVLDTCFSGNSDGGYLLRNISPAILKVESTTPIMNRSVIFTSSQNDQVSAWLHEKKHGLFTYYFLKGLSGAADSNQDLSITSTELGRYLSSTVPIQARKLNGHTQTPVLNQEKESIVAKLLSTAQASDKHAAASP